MLLSFSLFFFPHIIFHLGIFLSKSLCYCRHDDILFLFFYCVSGFLASHIPQNVHSLLSNYCWTEKIQWGWNWNTERGIPSEGCNSWEKGMDILCLYACCKAIYSFLNFHFLNWSSCGIFHNLYCNIWNYLKVYYSYISFEKNFSRALFQK